MPLTSTMAKDGITKWSAGCILNALKSETGGDSKSQASPPSAPLTDKESSNFLHAPHFLHSWLSHPFDIITKDRMVSCVDLKGAIELSNNLLLVKNNGGEKKEAHKDGPRDRSRHGQCVPGAESRGLLLRGQDHFRQHGVHRQALPSFDRLRRGKRGLRPLLLQVSLRPRGHPSPLPLPHRPGDSPRWLRAPSALPSCSRPAAGSHVGGGPGNQSALGHGSHRKRMSGVRTESFGDQ